MTSAFSASCRLTGLCSTTGVERQPNEAAFAAACSAAAHFAYRQPTGLSAIRLSSLGCVQRQALVALSGGAVDKADWGGWENSPPSVSLREPAPAGGSKRRSPHHGDYRAGLLQLHYCSRGMRLHSK